jgi:hypothetical protein
MKLGDIMQLNQATNLFGEPIYSYASAQALDDSVLVDVTHMAKETGFKIPVAVTHAVWEKYIIWADEDSQNQAIQDQEGRWDVLWMLYLACRRNKDESSVSYELYVIPRDGHSKSPVLVELKSVLGGGDAGEPVITIMLPNED